MPNLIATSQDLATYLHQDVDTASAQMLLDLAADLCTSILSPLPVTAKAVVIGVAARAYVNPANASSEAAGPFSVGYGTGATGGLYLSRQDRATLRRLAGSGGAFTVDPTPATAGQGLAPWDQNVSWLEGVPLAEDFR